MNLETSAEGLDDVWPALLACVAAARPDRADQPLRAGPGGYRFPSRRRQAARSGVLQEHRPGHRPDPAEPRGHPPGDLGDALVDVGEQPATLPRRPGADDGGTGLDHVRRDDAGVAGGGDDDVTLAHVVGEVGDTRVDDGHRGVAARPLQREEQRERAADRQPAPDDDNVATLHRHAVVAEQLDDPGGGAGKRPLDAHDEPTEVHRVEAVDVLVRVDGEQRGELVEVTRQRDLDEEGVDGRVAVEPLDGGEQLGRARVGTEVLVDRLDAHLGAILVLQGDIARARGSSPTRIVPSPG